MSADSNGDYLRDSNGRFAPGNKGGPGNPLVRKMASMRMAQSAAASIDDMFAVMLALTERAKKGDVAAIKEFLDRHVGKPVEADLQAKVDELEATLAEYMRRLNEDQEEQRNRIATTPDPETA